MTDNNAKQPTNSTHVLKPLPAGGPVAKPRQYHISDMGKSLTTTLGSIQDRFADVSQSVSDAASDAAWKTRLPKKNVTIACGLAAAACACALGLGSNLKTTAMSPSGGTSPSSDAPVATATYDDSEDASSELEPSTVLQATDITHICQDLKFDGSDVSVPTDKASVEVKRGVVYVTQALTEGDSVSKLEILKASMRCAALAGNLDDTLVVNSTSDNDVADDIEDMLTMYASQIVWTVCDDNGNPLFTLSYDIPCTTISGSLADVINSSAGWTFSDETFASISGDLEGIDQTGGLAPTNSSGDAIIVPSETVDGTQTDDAENPDNVESSKGDDSPAMSSSSSSPSTTGTGSSTTSSGSNSTLSNPSSSSSGGSTGPTTSNSSTSQSKVWIDEQGHWETKETKSWVVDTEAYDEKVEVKIGTKTTYVVSDGETFTSKKDAEAYIEAYEGTSRLTYKEVKEDVTKTETVHHDEVGHWETSYTKVWIVDVEGHWEYK